MIKRILAVVIAAILLILVIVTAVLGIIGSECFLVMFCIIMVIPVIMWGMLILYKVFNKDK